MADIDVTYKGSVIRSLSASGQEVLHTAGKLCEDDITIDYTQPGGGGANLQSKSVSYTPDETGISDTILPDPGYDGMDEVDVTVAAIPDTYVGSAIPLRDSTSLTSTGQVVHVPAGYYASAASRGVNNGTAGTPTASKGAVNNHSVDVTPSVTNTTGWITGSTIAGTPVSVSASELVSGSQTVTVNDTYDVTNLAQMVVNVSGAVSDTYGDPYTLFLGGCSYISGQANMFADGQLPATRRSIWSKTGDHLPQIYISNSDHSTNADFYPLSIPAGASTISVTPSKTCQVSISAFSYSGNAYSLVQNSGWLNSPVTNYSIPAGAEYIGIIMRVDSSNSSYTPKNQPSYVQIVWG